MSNPNVNVSGSESENLCVVCCKDVEIYSVGICDHPVCFECSTRMRVLCNQNECPICRRQMPKVIFTKDVSCFADLWSQYQQTYIQDRKFGLIFASEEIRKTYQQLLENRCNLCSFDRKCTFNTFQQLKDHMRRQHDLVYCDLCVDNLKIFASERKCYTKQQLGYHRRKGDPDNTSHRGHPLCEFCETRFMDSDELFRHLRRNHLFCHFCDADGKHEYYNSMDALRNHFRDDHYLCEEGECCNMPLTAVFRTDIDLKAHKATEHGRYLSKSASKQARTLELEFTLAPRVGAKRQGVQGRAQSRSIEEEGAVGGGYDADPGGGIKQIHALTPQDFPILGNSTVTVQSRPSSSVNFTSKLNPSLHTDDFPALGGSRTPAVTITTNTSKKKAPEVTITRTLRGGYSQNLQKNAENFPCLGPPPNSTSTVHLSVNNGQMSAPNVSIQVTRNGGVTTTHITTTPSTSSSNGFNVNQKPAEAFPALGSTPVPMNPQWVQQKSRKQESRINKVAPAPQLRPSDLRQFPTLTSKSEKKKSSSVTVPVSGTWSTSTTSNTKQSSNNNNLNKTNKNNEPSTSKILDNCIDNKSKSKKQKKKTGNVNNNNNNVDNEKWTENKNGIVKKRSELNIGALTLNDEVTKPPPGFPAKPPPGLSVTSQNFPNLIGSNDLTFTNSSGQSYSINPSTYRQLPNFSTRNQNLIKRLMVILEDDLIKEFKSYSSLFREDNLPSERYHEYCQVLLGDHFRELFPELLVLLPDIEKQQELYRVCDEESKRKLVVCENCKQVVYKRELKEHYSHHTLDSQFPTLGRSGETSNVWRK